MGIDKWQVVCNLPLPLAYEVAYEVRSALDNGNQLLFFQKK
jgi:hypothetical protein